MSHATQLGPPWIGKGARPDESGLFSGGFKQGLRLLAFLRVWSPIAQMLTLFVVTGQYGVHVPIEPVAALLVAEVMVAVATLIYLRQARHITALELMLQAHLDILMFAAMLYLTGGATNPFAPLFVLPMAVVASTLGTRHVWITVGSTMAAYVFLRYVHVPMYHPAGETQVHELHENGMVINYMFTAVLLAVFCSYMRSALSSHERLLADARATQMRNESVLAIGALAAGYAHELSSPSWCPSCSASVSPTRRCNRICACSTNRSAPASASFPTWPSRVAAAAPNQPPLSAPTISSNRSSSRFGHCTRAPRSPRRSIGALRRRRSWPKRP